MSNEKKQNDRIDKWQVSSEKKEVTIVLPYMCMISTELKVKLHKTFKQLLPACDLRVIFKVSLRMKNYFNFKDKIKRELRSLLVYNFKCNSCNAEYIGKTKRHYRTRTSEHIGVSPLTGKCLKNNSKTSPVHDHMLFVRQLFALKIFQFLLKVHAISNLKFKKVFWWNYESQLWTKTSPQYRSICFDIDSVTIHI